MGVDTNSQLLGFAQRDRFRVCDADDEEASDSEVAASLENAMKSTFTAYEETRRSHRRHHAHHDAKSKHEEAFKRAHVEAEEDPAVEPPTEEEEQQQEMPSTPLRVRAMSSLSLLSEQAVDDRWERRRESIGDKLEAVQRVTKGHLPYHAMDLPARKRKEVKGTESWMKQDIISYRNSMRARTIKATGYDADRDTDDDHISDDPAKAVINGLRNYYLELEASGNVKRGDDDDCQDPWKKTNRELHALLRRLDGKQVDDY